MSDLIHIHDIVQSRYSEIAQNQGDSKASCCGDDCCSDSSSSASCCDDECCGGSSNAQLYSAEMLEGLPVNVTGLSLGCGDPVTIAGLKLGETVLDLGSGGGIDCFLAARQVGESGTVIGVDMTPAMLEKANASKVRMGLSNVEFREGKIEALPVAADSIDVVMSNCVINLTPDKGVVFAEILRVLKPGGRMSVSDIVTEGDFSDTMRADAARWAECVTGAIDMHDYLNLLRETGFVNVVVVDKVDANKIVPTQAGMPRLFSARITAQKA